MKAQLVSISVPAFFCQGGGGGGGGEPFAQEIQVAQIFTKQSKGNEGHTMHWQWSTYEVKIFLRMNLSYEPKKHFKEKK